MTDDSRPFDRVTVERVNLVARFLADHHDPPPIDTADCVFILAGSAILQVATSTFEYLSQWTVPTTLIIAGGKGHSTQLLYEAIARHPQYRSLAAKVDGLPESQILELILANFWPGLYARTKRKTLTLLVETESKNCGENAEFALRMMSASGVKPRVITVIQEPTMSRRTAASVRKHLPASVDGAELAAVKVQSWPTFVPQLAYQDGLFSWSTVTLRNSTAVERPSKGLWTQQRFIDLILGEIPRLRDDDNGYGPRGKGFIPHIDIPPEVLQAYEQLRSAFVSTR